MIAECDQLVLSELLDMRTKGYGETPLQLAVHSGSRSTVKYLLQFCSVEKYTEQSYKKQTVFNIASHDFKMRNLLEGAFRQITQQ